MTIGAALGSPSAVAAPSRGGSPSAVAAPSRGGSPSAVTAPLRGGRPPASGGPRPQEPSSTPRAPSGPPLTTAAGDGPVAAEESTTSEGSAAAPDGGQDLLTGNGLDSPFCRQQADLAAAQRNDCQTARFAVAPYPTDSYMFDVDVDTGLGKWSNDASALLQNVTQLGWMALVSLTRGLVVMVEWCYSLGAGSRALMAQVAVRLRAIGVDFTQPLLALALSLAAALAAYRGLIRRQAAESVARALTTLAMMAVGLWLLFDPLDTVGVVQQWSDEAGAGTLAAVAAGAPERPTGVLADGLGQIFGVAVTAPWCYMEFGSVDWCQAPGRLDRRLRAAALRTVAKLRSQARCPHPCSQTDDAAVQRSRRSIALLQAAQTNGQLFLALPAEGPLRNSAKEDGTLLNVLCGGGQSASSCSGPTASQAEFRSERGTYGRAIGLLLIWIGGAGMLLLFGLLAIRLLLAGLLTIGYLLIAPAAVLVPVLGESGQAAFRAWIARLLAAAGSKLVYSFLLGVALLATSLVLRLAVLGWWAQWLLLSAFWWTAFFKRHEMLALLPLQPVATRHGRARRAGGTRRWRPAAHTLARLARPGAPFGAGEEEARPPLLPLLPRPASGGRAPSLSSEDAWQSAQDRERIAADRQRREAEQERRQRLQAQVREHRRQEAERRRRSFERYMEAIPEARWGGSDGRSD